MAGEVSYRKRTRGIVWAMVAIVGCLAWAGVPNALASSPGAATPGGETRGTPWLGQPGITETVNQIMARGVFFMQSPATDSLLELPRPGLSHGSLLPNPDALPGSRWPATGTSTPASGLPIGGLRTPQPAGISFLAGNIADSNEVPPDSMGDVGPTQILLCMNGRVRSFNRSGVADGVLDTPLDSFFNSVRNGSGTGDPRARYDRLSGRWFVDCISLSTPNRILMAVSSGATISGSSSFTFFQFQQDQPTPAGDTGNFADFDTLGVDANALYIGVNVFDPSNNFTESTGFVVNKSQLLQGSLVLTAFRGLAVGNGAGLWTPYGVDNDDPAATEGYFIGSDNAVFSQLDIRRVTNPGGVPSISGNIVISVPTNTDAMGPTPLGSTHPCDPLDIRLCSAKMHRGHLWTAQNIQVDATGTASNTGGRDGARWYDITNLTGTPTLNQAGTLFDPAASQPRSFWIPTLAMSGQGHMALGCSVAGATEHAEIAVAGRLAGDPLGTIQAPTVVQTSNTTYNIGLDAGLYRWGDYTQTSVDPTDDMTFWTMQEYCNATDSYGVRVVQLKAPPPAAPSACAPTSVVQGSTSIDVTLTGVSSSGSGFFDPGPGYPNHLSAAVSGSGVVVNSITYIDPTHVKLNLTVAADADTSARTITVTNPDGQIAVSSSSILTVLANNVPPPTPSGILAVPGDGRVTISWTSSPGATSYNIKRSTTSGSGYITVSNPSTTTFIDTGLTNGTTYYYVVSALNGSGESPNSGEVQATPTTLPVIASFTPSSGAIYTFVTLTGDNFTNVSSVKFNGLATNYSVNSNTSITASVPLGGTSGPISVTTPAGTGVSATSFTVPAPVITNFNPSSGSLGSTTTVTGSGFTGATAVKVNGVACNYSVTSDTSISLGISYSATTGPVSVTTPAGTGVSATNFTVNKPSISSFTPTRGSVNTQVVITGGAFTAVSWVSFNGAGCNFAVNSDTQIIASVPFGATTGPIQVISPAGTGTSTTNFTVNPPSITSFTPSSGSIGSPVTINGSSFTGVTAVKFNGVSCNFFYVSDTQINATVPPGFVSGPISVVTPAGAGDTSTLTPANYSVLGPTISNLSPNNGSLGGIVAINGSGFTGTTGVTFNGIAANYYINLDSQVVAFVPDTATSGPVAVTTGAGTSNTVTFTVNPPAITGLNPTHGSVGSFVTISGSGFTKASSVTFGGVSASFFVSSDTSINATVPAGFLSGTVSVTGPEGTGTSTDTFTVDVPTITSFSPTSGPVGTNVVVSGVHFTGATSIKFNGVTASLFVGNDGSISTTVPAGATTGPITVSGPGGTATSPTNFTVTP